MISAALLRAAVPFFLTCAMEGRGGRRWGMMAEWGMCCFV
ncbi:hypothetical protein SAMN05660976_00082 [Nonomuraea pusilla]|uniref:Uncharacterized protein n=1 Tax=Nonomuraea pusilla TaxID=46177 RepID=A0A1H7FIH8_9ACTN|nr:hypothetical protein SAMN05660976_00082 [Nonomuraea pusilla]